MTVCPIRLIPTDAERYARLRLRMLTDAPWAFTASPDDDPGPDQLAALLADHRSAIFAVEDTGSLAAASASGGTLADLVAAAGIVRTKRQKHAHRARIWGVFVEPAHRGRGLGRSVVCAAIDLARAWSGVEYIDLGVSENAPEAGRLYERLGFRTWGREPEATLHDGRRYDEIHMTLKL